MMMMMMMMMTTMTTTKADKSTVIVHCIICSLSITDCITAGNIFSFFSGLSGYVVI